jgi:nucleotide-binding universal stress UspA family protein
MTFKSILIAYDGSETSKKAASAAAELADRFHAKVEAIYVMELPVDAITMELAEPATPDVQEKLKGDGLKILDEAQLLLGTANHPLFTLLEGSPGPSIIKYAETTGSDLIMVGHRGLNRMEELLVGSVSNYIIRHAHCPVMVMKD